MLYRLIQSLNRSLFAIFFGSWSNECVVGKSSITSTDIPIDLKCYCIISISHFKLLCLVILIAFLRNYMKVTLPSFAAKNKTGYLIIYQLLFAISLFIFVSISLIKWLFVFVKLILLLVIFF